MNYELCVLSSGIGMIFESEYHVTFQCNCRQLDQMEYSCCRNLIILSIGTFPVTMSTGNDSFEVEGSSEMPNLRHKDGTPTPLKARGTGKDLQLR